MELGNKVQDAKYVDEHGLSKQAVIDIVKLYGPKRRTIYEWIEIRS